MSKISFPLRRRSESVCCDSRAEMAADCPLRRNQPIRNVHTMGGCKSGSGGAHPLADSLPCSSCTTTSKRAPSELGSNLMPNGTLRNALSKAALRATQHYTRKSAMLFRA